MAYKNLIKAKNDKKDEFYTQIEDIENEVKHYKEQFKDKIVLCNCDDPFESNFFKYFALNFNDLKLKKLICTCYEGSPIVTEQLSLLDVKGLIINKVTERKPYKIEITEVIDENGDGAIDLSDVEYLLKNKKNVLTLLKGDGDFRSEECLGLLKEADIVVTNPPFSLFRQYVSILQKYKKNFLIMGNINSILCKEIFPLFKNNSTWLGYQNNCSMKFRVPDDYYGDTYDENGNKIVTVPGISWYTNLDVSKRHEKQILFKKYSPEEYFKYDNFDGIHIEKTAFIPKDYSGFMGVSVTFLSNYNPEQFRLIGLGSGDAAKEIGVKKNYRGRTDLSYTDENGKHKCPYTRIVIQLINPEVSEEDNDENTIA